MCSSPVSTVTFTPLLTAGTITHSAQRETWPLNSCGSWACCRTAQMRLIMLRCALFPYLCWTYIDWSRSPHFDVFFKLSIYATVWILGSARTWHRLGECPLQWWVPTRIWGCCSWISFTPNWARYKTPSGSCGPYRPIWLPWTWHLLSLSSNLSVNVSKTIHQLQWHIHSDPWTVKLYTIIQKKYLFVHTEKEKK